MCQLNAMAPGHKDTVLILLQAGARRSTVNNMGKNVVQLGSFVGELWGTVRFVSSCTDKAQLGRNCCLQLHSGRLVPIYKFHAITGSGAVCLVILGPVVLLCLWVN